MALFTFSVKKMYIYSTAEMYAYAQDSIVLKMFTLLLATNKCIEDSRDRHGLQYKLSVFVCIQ